MKIVVLVSTSSDICQQKKTSISKIFPSKFVKPPLSPVSYFRTEVMNAGEGHGKLYYE